MKKRLLTLLVAGCMIFSMTACGTETKEAEDTADHTTEEGTGEAAQPDDSVIGTSTVTELGQYLGLSYEAYEITVTEEEVEEKVQAMLSENSTETPVEVVAENSYVNIDYVGKKDDVAFDNGTAQSQEISIQNSGYIDGFAESIVGMKVGETKDCPMTFPEDYHAEDLAGQEVVFTITVNEAWEMTPAELNDAFAQENGYDNVEALYAGVKEKLAAEKETTEKNYVKSELIQQVIDQSTFDMNEEEIAYYVEAQKSEQEYYAQLYGMDLESYVTIFGMTLEEFEETCREMSIYQIQRRLVLSAIAEKESIEATEEEYQTYAEEYRSYYGAESIEALEEAYTKEAVALQVVSDLTADFVAANAVAE